MSALALLFRLPAFLFGTGCLFWIFELASLTGFVKWWKLGGPRNDVEQALRFLKWVFRYRVVQLGDAKPITSRKCMYLCNHRSWADFFVDMYVTGARAVPLSRRAVGFAFPAFTSSLIPIKSILLFNRAGIRDTEKFNAWLDKELVQGPQNSLLVYPEGTRSQKQQSLPLKRGMLRYAFTRKLPVQVVVTAGKDFILNERRRWAHFGCTLVCGCSDLLESQQFGDFEEFAAAVQQLWDAQWARVHAASPQGLPDLAPSFPELRYTPAQLAAQSAALAGWTAALAAGLYCCARLAAWLAAAPGGGVLLAVLALWAAASLAAAAMLQPPARKGGVGGGSGAVGGGSSSSMEGADAKQD